MLRPAIEERDVWHKLVQTKLGSDIRGPNVRQRVRNEVGNQEGQSRSVFGLA